MSKTGGTWIPDESWVSSWTLNSESGMHYYHQSNANDVTSHSNRRKQPIGQPVTWWAGKMVGAIIEQPDSNHQELFERLCDVLKHGNVIECSLILQFIYPRRHNNRTVSSTINYFTHYDNVRDRFTEKAWLSVWEQLKSTTQKQMIGVGVNKTSMYSELNYEPDKQELDNFFHDTDTADDTQLADDSNNQSIKKAMKKLKG